MIKTKTILHGSLLGLVLAMGLAAPAFAQNDRPAAAADIDFGDDSSDWANDGECDDPRFTGEGAAEELIDADRMHDATDCQAAFEAGTVTLAEEEADTDADAKTNADTETPEVVAAPPATADIDFGDDSSDWANDGECDDPRFTGEGAAEELVDADRMHDATDCQAAFEAGTVTLAEEEAGTDADTPDVVTAPPTPAADIDFGDDTSDWANDGECDDPRFTGEGAAEELIDADRMHDATDCQAAFEAGTVTLAEEEAETDADTPDVVTAPPADTDIDFGDDSSDWANDGECDDPRFAGEGAAEELLDEDRMHDATDCQAAFEAGTVTLKSDTASDASAIDFGNDSSEWANDGECDDPRFEGDGAWSDASNADILKDASDCRAAYEAGTVTLKADADDLVAAANEFDFGSDFSRWANDGECDDPRFEGNGMAKKLMSEDMLGDATDCRALVDSGDIAVIPVFDPAYAAGAPYDSAGIDFGDNTSSYANDDQCDDPRFRGPGAAATMLDSDLKHDRDDCRAAFEAGTVTMF